MSVTSRRYLLIGKKGRGKDTLADAIVKYQFGMYRTAFAKALKAEVKALTINVVDLEDPTTTTFAEVNKLLANRELMGLAWQWWGEFRRRIDPMYWIDQVVEEVQDFDDIIITDGRHHNEVNWAVGNGFTVIRVEGPDRRGTEDSLRNSNHESERYVDKLHYDLLFTNEGSLSDIQTWVERNL